MLAGMPFDVSVDLRSVVGSEHVLVDDDLRAGYETDWTGRYSGKCLAVVRPTSTAETCEIVSYCNVNNIAIVTQGGNTGLVGAGVPRSAETGARPSILLSMSRLAQLDPVDTSTMQVTAGAGVTLASWRAHARSAGLDAPVDFAARDSATIGGAIATNAGGSRVVRFGTMRQQVVGIEAVLANGQIVGSLSGLPKETVGMHWPSLLAGSEGTLAVVTAARLRLVPWFNQTITALIAVETLDHAVDLLGRLRRHVASLDAVELIEPTAMELVAGHLDRSPPITAPVGGSYLMIDCADHVDPSRVLLDAISGAPGIVDAAATTDAPRRDDLLQFRDRITEAVSAAATATGQPTFKLDVAVPVPSLRKLLTIAQQAADTDGARLIPFGHLAEGNLHLNYLGATNTERIAETVLNAVADLGGTISAEHGVGIAKTRWLHLIREAGDLAAQSAIKHALDPNMILNPGVLHPEVTG
jgi:FAD/FMN-containing dehydrogenase